MRPKIIKVLMYYDDKGKAFLEATKMAIKRRYSGVYVFKPDQAETPINEFYYVVVGYKGDLDIMDRRQVDNLWEDSIKWMKEDSKTWSYKINQIWENIKELCHEVKVNL